MTKNPPGVRLAAPAVRLKMALELTRLEPLTVIGAGFSLAFWDKGTEAERAASSNHSLQPTKRPPPPRREAKTPFPHHPPNLPPFRRLSSNTLGDLHAFSR